MGCSCSKECCWEVAGSPKESHGHLSRGKGKTDSSVSRVSSDEAGEEEDQLNQLTVTRESDVGIARLSRVSSQYLPPEGSRRVRVPLGNYELQYSYLSQRGYYPEALDKPNQDSFCIHSPFGACPDDHFFGVFDGHGEYGAQCSQFVKKKLCENILRNGKFRTDAVEALYTAFLATNAQLHADNLEDSMSGTTAITVLVRGRTIYVANAGDSRAVIAEKNGDEVIAVDLSLDHTPYRDDELERVKSCGARVLTLDQIEGLKNPDVQCWGLEEGDDGDPPRLWAQNGMYPGTAFTRSIGDSIAESIGVVAVPEIFILELTPSHPFFVLASDGVFEFLSSQHVVDMAAKHNDPRDACAAIVAESYRLWLQFETRTDDITIIVVHVNGLTETETVQTSKIVPLRPVQQVVELTGSESPSALRWNSKNHRSRHDLSRAQLRALESSLESGCIWNPPSPSHRKTWEEEAHIEQALRDHFLFRKLTNSQCQVLIDCMQRVDVKPGDVVVREGGEGDCFYVVGSGEFEVFALQVEEGKEVTKVLHRYTAEKLSSFGELALMYNKPLQASVRAVTSGTLWALQRQDFRGILMSEFSNLPSLKLLRSVEVLSRLTILQLSRVAASLTEVSFKDGDVVINEEDCLTALYIIRKGHLNLRIKSDVEHGLLSAYLKQSSYRMENGSYIIDIPEGGHFGEWALLGENIYSLTVISTSDVTCAVLTRENFESIVSPQSKATPLKEHPPVDSEGNDGSTIAVESAKKDQSLFIIEQLADVDWMTMLCADDYVETGLVIVQGNIRVLKRFDMKKIQELGKEEQVMKEKQLIESLNPSTWVPQVLHTCKDDTYMGILLDCCLACPLGSILHRPLDEPSAKYYAASVVAALEELHQRSIFCGGVSSDLLMVDTSGHLQFVDFRYAKSLADERIYTVCGNVNSLAPEIVLGKGHGLAADWWALGILIYFMLRTEMPFGSWRESEMDPISRIAEGRLELPETLSKEASDVISELLEVNETARLGSKGAASVKGNPWFHGIDWEAIADGSFPVPKEITFRIEHLQDDRMEDFNASTSSAVFGPPCLIPPCRFLAD